jgi:prepilin-type N-terminal cleavage/methylation domain-containing protein
MHMRNDRGFSLVEILIAIAILGVGFLVLAALFPMGSLSLRRAEQVSMATSLAREGVERVRAIPAKKLQSDLETLLEKAKGYTYSRDAKTGEQTIRELIDVNGDGVAQAEGDTWLEYREYVVGPVDKDLVGDIPDLLKITLKVFWPKYPAVDGDEDGVPDLANVSLVTYEDIDE